MKILAKILAVFCITSFAFAQTIEVQAGVTGSDLVDGLAYVNGGNPGDTLLLVTDGGIYELSTADSISVPLTIMAAGGLTDKPIIRASAGDTCESFFEVWADLTVEGIIFDGERTDGTLNPFDDKMVIGGVPHPDGTWPRSDITIRDCEFMNVYQTATPATDNAGCAFRTQTDAFLGNLVIEGTTFSNIIDEPIMMQNAMKTENGDGRPADTVIVRNCTFINCAGPKNQGSICIKGDDDSTTVDAKIILDHLTFYNSAPNSIYCREIENMEVRNIVIANTDTAATDYSSAFLIRVQRNGTVVSHIDTFGIGVLTSDPFRVGEGQNTGAGMATLDTATIYAYDPAFTDAPNGDLTLLAGSEICDLGSDGAALGDARWAGNCGAPAGVENDLNFMPRAFALSQNYPNPFNPATTINYTLESRAAVKLEIFDLTGSRIATLVDDVKSAGPYSVVWNASDAASGIYFYKITADGQSLTRKMMFLK